MCDKIDSDVCNDPDMTHSYVRHLCMCFDAPLFARRPFSCSLRGMTHSDVWHDLFIKTTHPCVWQDSFQMCAMIQTRLIHMCDIHVCVLTPHLLFGGYLHAHCVTWLTCVCDKLTSYICGNAYKHTATHWNSLQHTATHCNPLQHTTTHCNSLQHTATHCNTLQHAATHCNLLAPRRDTSAQEHDYRALQCVAVCCSVLQCVAVCCSVLQCVAVCCSVLQCVAVCCNLL